jgi:hypothetical protein
VLEGRHCRGIESARERAILELSTEEPFMSRMYPQSAVGIALDRAVLCPNDETVYDAERWNVCPTCVNKEGISLSKILGGPAASVGVYGAGWNDPLMAGRTMGGGLLAKATSSRGEH